MTFVLLFYAQYLSNLIDKSLRWVTDLAVYSIVAIDVIFIIAHAQAEHLVIDNTTNGVIVKFKDKRSIESDSNYFYIGKTNNYIFFHDKTIPKTYVHSTEGLKSIEFPDLNLLKGAVNENE